MASPFSESVQILGRFPVPHTLDIGQFSQADVQSSYALRYPLLVKSATIVSTNSGETDNCSPKSSRLAIGLLLINFSKEISIVNHPKIAVPT